MQAGALPVSARQKTYARSLYPCVVAALLITGVPTPGDAQARGGSRHDSLERGIIRKINTIRRAHGLPKLRANRALGRSADYHCTDMLRMNFFAHSSSNGQTFAQRVANFRPSNRIGETLAYVPTADRDRSARRIVQLWMNSPPHRASLLSPGFRRIGVARRKGALGSLRVVVFTADFASAH